jgi:hypothetical protein
LCFLHNIFSICEQFLYWSDRTILQKFRRMELAREAAVEFQAQPALGGGGPENFQRMEPAREGRANAV